MAVGWPGGCNKVMGDTFWECIRIARRNNAQDEFVLFLEADDVPLKKDWLDRINREYRMRGKMVMGAWSQSGDGGLEHINGNMCMSVEFFKACPDILHVKSKVAWDNYLWRQIKPHAAPSKEIWNDWRLGTGDNPWMGADDLWQPKRYRDPTNPLYGEELHPSMIHGVKHPDGLEEARRRLVSVKIAENSS
jgi:hypothetical protein